MLFKFHSAISECAVQRLRHSEDGDSLVDADMLLRLSTQSCLERLQDQRQQKTPLSGRGYVISAEQVLGFFLLFLFKCCLG